MAKLYVSFEKYPFTAEWEGGEYINVIYSGQAFHVINVWDFNTQTATIPFTRAALRKEVLEWAQDPEGGWNDYKDNI